MKALLDTSVLVADDQLPTLLPEECAISVVTLAELHLGILVAKNAALRARRLGTLSWAEREFRPLVVDDDTARLFAVLLSEARAKGLRPKSMDTWIAATAVQHNLVLFTRDSDFRSFPQVQLRLL